MVGIPLPVLQSFAAGVGEIHPGDIRRAGIVLETGDIVIRKVERIALPLSSVPLI